MKLQLPICDFCHPILVAALLIFQEKITPSHSTTSRRYSIWSLCKTAVEPAMKEALDEKLPGRYEAIIGPKGFVVGAKQEARRLEDRLRLVAKHYSNMLRCDTGGESKRIYDTIETIIYLIHFCRSHRPKSKMDERFGVRRRKPLRIDHYPYCELCWRLCLEEEGRLSGIRPPENEKGDPIRSSSRFCNIHDPRDPRSSYRTDHNHRDDFHQKIIQLEKALSKGTNSPGIEKLRTALANEYYIEGVDELLDGIRYGKYDQDSAIKEKKHRIAHKIEQHGEFEIEEITRRIAYQLVHPQNSTHRRKGETRERALVLQVQGLSQAEIGRRLGVTRDAICKALKKRAPENDVAEKLKKEGTRDLSVNPPTQSVNNYVIHWHH